MDSKELKETNEINECVENLILWMNDNPEVKSDEKVEDELEYIEEQILDGKLSEETKDKYYLWFEFATALRRRVINEKMDEYNELLKNFNDLSEKYEELKGEYDDMTKEVLKDLHEGEIQRIKEGK